METPIPLWRDSGLIDYVNKADLPSRSNGEVINAKLPYNAMVTAYLKINSPAGLLIGIQTDNYMGGRNPNVRAEYVTQGGTQEFEALAFSNGHAVQYSIPSGVEIIDLKYRETRMTPTGPDHFHRVILFSIRYGRRAHHDEREYAGQFRRLSGSRTGSVVG
jgi:hypothetical protein